VDTSKGATKAAAAKTAKTNGKKLNLTAPDVSTVVPEQELKEPLQNPDQVTEVQEAQTVSVKTNEGVPPDVPGGLGAIWWAVVHPSQAWRIVTPAEKLPTLSQRVVATRRRLPAAGLVPSTFVVLKRFVYRDWNARLSH
jgi:hypothetical protein